MSEKTNARLAEYVGYDGWNAKAASGAGIQSAADYAIGFTPGPGEAASELFPQVAHFDSALPIHSLISTLLCSLTDRSRSCQVRRSERKIRGLPRVQRRTVSRPTLVLLEPTSLGLGACCWAD